MGCMVVGGGMGMIQQNWGGSHWTGGSSIDGQFPVFPGFPVLPAQRDGQTADSSPFALDFT